QFGFELVPQFRLPTAELLLRLRLRSAHTSLRLCVQLLLPLSESDLRRAFPSLHFLFPARLDFPGTVIDLALELQLAEPRAFLDFVFFLRQPTFEGESQF